MRRSAAPSQLYHAKRPRFNPPIHKETGPTSEIIPNQVPGSEDTKPSPIGSSRERSKKDILNLITNGTTTSKDGINTAKPPTASDISKCQTNQSAVESRTDAILPSHQQSTSTTSNFGCTTKAMPRKGFKTPTIKAVSITDVHDEKGSFTSDSRTESGIAAATATVQDENQDSPKAKVSVQMSKGPSKFCPPVGGSRSPLTQKPYKHGLQDNGDEPKIFYYNIVWCKLSKKKHKKWEGDAILCAKGRSVTLMDTEGKEIGKGSGYKVADLASLAEGHTLVVGGKEIEVMSVLNEEDYKSGKCFQTATMVTNKKSVAKPTVASKAFVKPQLNGTPQVKAAPVVVRPKFDPLAPGALVMPRPDQTHEWEHNRQRLPVVDVVVDPHVAHHLRPHQREGIVFLYQCVMGMKDFTGQGAILADEMGLGKTLQCISLIWTLHKQGPYGGKPSVRRVLVITPGSLVKNWVREFNKWLGSERLKVFAVGSENKTTDFAHCTVYPVMIISYEMFMRNAATVKAVNFDLVVCDEGHRLKNTNIKTTSLMMGLETRRRIVLTGTPVQNDLKELFSIVEFCNPGILGTSSAFQHVYAAPILASRKPAATPAEETLGEMRAQELNRVTGMFILRRTQDINNKYLPPKVEIVLFCQLAPLQLELYRKLLSSRAVKTCLTAAAGAGDAAQHLMCISALKKLCNCPSLLHKNAVQAAQCQQDEPDRFHGYSTEKPDFYRDLLPLYPAGYDAGQLMLEHCSKLRVVDQLLKSAHSSTPPQRVVLVSNYTQTLDVLVRLLEAENYSFLRLDGQTPTSKRQELVEKFNNAYSNVFVFLLSSKAGGVGLNLIGASRLILYDIDWNPANDLQAMARIWRDGQRQRVFIYRLLTTGSLEEKMYQRQVSKQALSGVVVDSKTNSKLNFSPEELKDLFRLREDSLCCTHDLLGCKCESLLDPPVSAGADVVALSRPCQLKKGTQSTVQKNLCMDELMEWRHEKGPSPELSHVDPLTGDMKLDDVTYAFWNVSGVSSAT